MMTEDIVSDSYPLADENFQEKCKNILDGEGTLVLPGFVQAAALELIRQQGMGQIQNAYFCVSTHNVYLLPKDADFADDHARNREVISSKGLIGDDQIPGNSPLKILYRDKTFSNFVAAVVGEKKLYSYADPLSSVNVHYAKTGQELGWHFDNSSFAITLLIDKPEAGGEFEYVKDLRDADAGDMNYEAVTHLLDGLTKPQKLQMEPGTLVLFRGRNSIHRVTPTQGDKIRMLAVLAYNSQPGISLSESARKTFYGRLA